MSPLFPLMLRRPPKTTHFPNTKGLRFLLTQHPPPHFAIHIHLTPPSAGDIPFAYPQLFQADTSPLPAAQKQPRERGEIQIIISCNNLVVNVSPLSGVPPARLGEGRCLK